MVSRREAIKRIEQNLRELRERKKLNEEERRKLRERQQELQGQTRTPLPQRRFGLPVKRVQERQRQVLQFRQESREGVDIIEGRIDELNREDEDLEKTIILQQRQRKAVRDLGSTNRQRREDIRAGLIKVRSGGELIPLVLPEDVKTTVQIQEVGAQQLGSNIVTDYVKQNRRERIIEAGTKGIQQITDLLLPREAEERKRVEKVLEQRGSTNKQFNKDVEDFNRKYTGRLLGDQEYSKAQKEALALEQRGNLINLAENKLQSDLKAIDIRRTESRFKPEELGKGFATGILTAPLSAVVLGTKLLTEPIRTIKETPKSIATSFKEEPLRSTGGILGSTLVLEAGIRGAGKGIRALTRGTGEEAISLAKIKNLNKFIGSSEYGIIGRKELPSGNLNRDIARNLDFSKSERLFKLRNAEQTLSQFKAKLEQVIPQAPTFRSEFEGRVTPSKKDLTQSLSKINEKLSELRFERFTSNEFVPTVKILRKPKVIKEKSFSFTEIDKISAIRERFNIPKEVSLKFKSPKTKTGNLGKEILRNLDYLKDERRFKRINAEITLKGLLRNARGIIAERFPFQKTAEVKGFKVIQLPKRTIEPSPLPRESFKEVTTKSGQVLLLKNEPKFKTINVLQSKQLQRQRFKQRSLQLAKSSYLETRSSRLAFKSVSASALASSSAYSFAQPSALAFKFKQPQAYSFAQPQAFAFAQPQALSQSQRFGTPNRLRTTQLSVTRSPPIPRLKLEPTFPRKKKKKRQSRSFSDSITYQPSLTARVFNIRVKVPKTQLRDFVIKQRPFAIRGIVT